MAKKRSDDQATKKPMFKGEDGTLYPVYEAKYSTAFTVYKTDKKKAQIGNPFQCIEAKGLCRQPNVKEAQVSSGRFAYVVYEGQPDHEDPTMREDHAIRFSIRAQASNVRDAFDLNKEIKTQVIMLHPVPPGRTLTHRSKLNRARKIAVKNGAVRKKNNPPVKTRVRRLGIHHRPRATIVAA